MVKIFGSMPIYDWFSTFCLCWFLIIGSTEADNISSDM